MIFNEVERVYSHKENIQIFLRRALTGNVGELLVNYHPEQDFAEVVVEIETDTWTISTAMRQVLLTKINELAPFADAQEAEMFFVGLIEALKEGS